MKKILFILFFSICFYSCNKCQNCYVVEYEADGVTVKKETLIGEYCGSNARKEAEDKANADGITCQICHIECR